MSLCICPLDNAMGFDPAHFEDHPNPVRHVLIVETISPSQGLFMNAMRKAFGSGATFHYEVIDDLGIVDGRLVHVPAEPISPEMLIRRGLDRVKAAGAKSVAFLHSGQAAAEIDELLTRAQIDGLEVVVADWSDIATM